MKACILQLFVTWILVSVAHADEKKIEGVNTKKYLDNGKERLIQPIESIEVEKKEFIKSIVRNYEILQKNNKTSELIELIKVMGSMSNEQISCLLVDIIDFRPNDISWNATLVDDFPAAAALVNNGLPAVRSIVKLHAAENNKFTIKQKTIGVRVIIEVLGYHTGLAYIQEHGAELVGSNTAIIDYIKLYKTMNVDLKTLIEKN
jgi:hypothetical protein